MAMSILDELVHMTVRIECDGGRSSGTGFIFNFCERDEQHIPAIVTNKHLVANAQVGVFHMTVQGSGGCPKLGEHVPITLPDFEALWLKHPDQDIDLAAFPIGPIVQAGMAQGTPLFYKAAGKDFIADSAFMNELNAVEDILMIGYPNGLWDKKNNLPITRRGVTATPPSINFEGRPEFMIDCACFPGSSGSPVVLFNMSGYLNKNNNVSLGSRVKLLGILWGGPQHLAPGVVRAVPVPTAHQGAAFAQIPNNLGYCVKAEQLLAFEEHFAELVAAQERAQGEARVEPAHETSESKGAVEAAE